MEHIGAANGLLPQTCTVQRRSYCSSVLHSVVVLIGANHNKHQSTILYEFSGHEQTVYLIL